MFKRISIVIALQFTAFVFLLFLVNGTIFLAADFGNARRQTYGRLVRLSQIVLEMSGGDLERMPELLPPPVRDHVRIIGANGRIIYSSGFFSGLPFDPSRRFFQMRMHSDEYSVLTAEIPRGQEPFGYVQIAEVERLQFGELPPRVMIYLIVSGVISALTFVVGLFFARRSLAPAEAAMQRLEQFTQDASHELRTPIATMNSSLDLALSTKQYREGIISAKEDVAQMARLIDRLLELTRLDSFFVERLPVDFSALVEETVTRHAPLAEKKGVTMQSKVTPQITVKGDAPLLRQVITNLLTNAVKCTPEKGRITVELSKHALMVEDTGIGISKEAIDHIFDRFFQVDPSRAHGGLGL